MKKRIFSSLLLILIFILCSSLVATFGNSGTVKAADKNPAVQETNFTLSVGEEIDFTDYFYPYNRNQSFTYTVEDEEIVYVNSVLNRLIALKAGETVVSIESDNSYSDVTITVELEDFNPDPGFDTIRTDARWTESNETIDGWRLYTGGGAVGSDQVVELYTDDSGNHMIHYNHPTQYYANLYKDLTGLPAGQYYVTVRMRGENVSNNNCFIRLNLNNQYGQTTTERLTGSFDGVFESPIFRLAEGENLRLELYFANNIGEVWFDDLHVYRVITTDYTTFMVEKSVESMIAGDKAQINCVTVPESVVSFEYQYESDNESVATVSNTGEITAVSDGVATITVKDKLYGYTREVLVIVGIVDGITAVVNNGQAIQVEEDSQTALVVSSDISEDFTVYYYANPLHGDYYITEDNKIMYAPAADYYTTGDNKDRFEVLVSDNSGKGYVIVPVEITILPVSDEIGIVDFWHSVEKNGELAWQANPRYNYDHHINTNVGGEAAGLYGGGYLQVQSYDIEVLYPIINNGEISSNSAEQQAYRKAKADMYKEVVGTGVDGSLTITTENGGTVNILYDGKAQEVEDRYYESQGKFVHAIIYEYTPAKDFIGYDHFDIKITKDDKEVTFTNTVYVLPSMEDFAFDSTDFSGTYVLSKDEWLEEVRVGYENGDPYITTWVRYYEAQYASFVPEGVPANARTPMEQLAILWKITQNEKYLDACWDQLYEVVKTKESTGSEDEHQDWGHDTNGFLDAAMVTYSVGFTYNYIKDKLTDAQKELVLQVLYEEGFYYFENLNNVNVLLHGNNHNLLVCGDLAVAALAVMDYEGDLEVTVNGQTTTINVREVAADIVATAFRYLQIGLVHYSESGGFPEGPSYSIYAHRNMVNLIATLYNLYGADEQGNINCFGLMDIEGIKNYINYPLYTSTPNYQSFYYAESDYSNNQPALLWYTRIDEDNINAAVLPLLAHENEQYNIQNLLWYQPGLFDKVDLHNMENKDFLLEAHELATFRSEFGDEMAVFTGLKGVDDHTANFSHKNLDSGTFELYALGERFIGNYSNETYNTNVPDGYWDYEYQRWTYYKKGAQGQNTLVINPDQEPVLTQDPHETAPITRFESNASSGLSIIDLSRVYKAEALSVQRGLKLFNNRQYVMVQDEFNLRGESTLYWSAHTEARVDILSDKLARLTLNNKSIYALIISDLGTFTKMSGNTPLPGSTGLFENLDNRGVTKLVIELDDIVSGTLAVVFIPTMEEVKEFTDYNVVPLANWALDENDSYLPEITADDISFDLDTATDFGLGYLYEFNKYQYNYLVKLAAGSKSVPDFKVTYDESKYDLTINKSNLFDNISTVTLTDKETGESRTYNYKFVVDVMTQASEYASYQTLAVQSVTGHADAANLIDGQNSGLTDTGVQEITFEFANVQTITDVLIRFNGGINNKYYFDIAYSEDGENYKNAYFAGQSFNNIGNEVYSLGNFDAKYVKITFYGNNNDDTVNVAEVTFLDNGTRISNPTNNNNMRIIVGCICGAVVLVAAGVTVFLVIKRRKKNND